MPSLQKMRITPFAIFESDFADDSVENGGDIVVPGGQTIMHAIYDRLKARGYHVSNFDQHSHYGWSFDLRGKEGSFWLLLQYAGPWLLIVNDARMIWSRMFGGQVGFAAIIDQCRLSLELIPQIRSISWMSRREYEAEFHHKAVQDRNA